MRVRLPRMTVKGDTSRNGFGSGYQGALLPSRPTLTEVRSTLTDYHPMLLSIMHIIAERSERNYRGRLLDTKFSTLTGVSYPADDPIRGPGIVYGYIQGRGLEALAEHCRWIEKSKPDPEAARLKT